MTLEEFTAAAEEFVAAHADPVAEEEPIRWGQGYDSFGLFTEQSRDQERADVAAAKAWRRKIFDAGFGWITGPPEYGGRGLDRTYERAWQQVLGRFDTPNLTALRMGTEMIGPTILEHGTESARKDLLRGIYRGDVVCCQLFSEPGAGSDLAGLRTSARRDGDGWRIDGQKVWTSHAHYADVAEIICRTDPDAPKHRGLTAFVVDMRDPGIEVRALRQMTGGASFNEVFLDGVQVTDEYRLGEPGDGWPVALYTLARERDSIGSGAGLAVSMDLLAEMVRHFGAAGDPLVRQRFARLYANSRTAPWTRRRLAGTGGGGAIGKLALTRDLQLVSELVGEVLGSRMVADTGEWGTYSWGRFVLGVPGLRIAGGTDEVLRTVVAERTLGLPKE